MRGKLTSFLLIVGLILVSLVVSNVLSSQKKPLKRESTSAASGQTIASTRVELQDINNDIRISGRLVVMDRIDLYSEVAGKSSDGEQPFRAGNRFSEGDTLLQIDASIFQLNLLAQKSNLLNQLTGMLPDLKLDFPEEALQWERYISEFSLETALAPLPEDGPAALRYFLGARNIHSTFYTTRSMEETLSRYTLLAPFDGILSETMVTAGTWVRSAQQVGVYLGTDLFELQSAVAISQLKQLRIGQEVTLTCDAVDGEFTGHITRLNYAVDSRTETVGVSVAVADKHLLDGLYLSGTIRTSTSTDVAIIPITAIVNQNQLYEIQDGVLHLRSVEILRSEDDNLYVQGLKTGDLILTVVIPGARDGVSLTELRQS
jgi:membrane fusion protein, multidrug efflux system